MTLFYLTNKDPRQNATARAQDIIDAVYGELHAFKAGLRPQDYITLVVIKMEGNQSSRQF